MIIREKILPINPYSRPGYKREETLGVVFHWVSAPGQTAEQTHRYFKQLAESKRRYASAHYIVGMDGEIIKCVPEEEMAYHVGASKYTDLAKEKFKAFTTNRKVVGYDDEYWTPNWCTIGIEMNHPDESGRFTKATIKSAQELGSLILKKHYLGIENVYRHYDISFDKTTGFPKMCPRWFVNCPLLWYQFKETMNRIDYVEETDGK